MATTPSTNGGEITQAAHRERLHLKSIMPGRSADEISMASTSRMGSECEGMAPYLPTLTYVDKNRTEGSAQEL
jgi:hypothetical protein